MAQTSLSQAHLGVCMQETLAPRRQTTGLRLFLAEDHLLVRQGLRSILQEEGFAIAGEASDGHTAVEACAALRPDIAILDLAMPRLNGIDAARVILQRCPQTKIILLTMYADESCVLTSLRAGIRGYVLKNNAAETLVAAIHAVANDQTYLIPGVAGTVVQAYLSNTDARIDPLSGREREVLQLIAESRNVKEIAGMLGISVKTAESHRARLMAKLHIHDVAGLVRYAIEHRLISVQTSGMREEFVAGQQIAGSNGNGSGHRAAAASPNPRTPQDTITPSSDSQ